MRERYLCCVGNTLPRSHLSSPFLLSSLPPSLPASPGIDVEEMKSIEEAAMLEDAQRLKNDPSLKSPISVGGATPLHIAAAKSYLRVLK